MMNLFMTPRYFNQTATVPIFSKYKNLGKEIAEEFYKRAKNKSLKNKLKK